MDESEDIHNSKLLVVDKNVNSIELIDEKSKSINTESQVYIKTKFKTSLLQYITEQLRDTIFSGWLGEREYVENLEAYRDVVQINEWETTLNQKLKNIVQNVKGVMEGTRWINITAPSSIHPCYRLWVLLRDPPFPGHYWMQIQDVFSESEFGLKISVKILREVSPFDGETHSEREKRLKGDHSVDEWKDWVLLIADMNLKGTWDFVSRNVTPSTINQGIRFIIILGVTLVVSLISFLQYFGKFLLRFVRELGIFIHNATPFTQSVITLIEKLFGGLYLLIAMIYKDLRRPNSPQPAPAISNDTRSLHPTRDQPQLTYIPPEYWRNKEYNRRQI